MTKAAALMGASCVSSCAEIAPTGPPVVAATDMAPLVFIRPLLCFLIAFQVIAPDSASTTEFELDIHIHTVGLYPDNTMLPLVGNLPD